MYACPCNTFISGAPNKFITIFITLCMHTSLVELLNFLIIKNSDTQSARISMKYAIWTTIKYWIGISQLFKCHIMHIPYLCWRESQNVAWVRGSCARNANAIIINFIREPYIRNTVILCNTIHTRTWRYSSNVNWREVFILTSTTNMRYPGDFV